MRSTNARDRSRESGIALIVTLGIMALLLIVALGFASVMRTEQARARSYRDSAESRYVARAAMERALAEIADIFENAPSNAWGQTIGSYVLTSKIDVAKGDRATLISPIDLENWVDLSGDGKPLPYSYDFKGSRFRLEPDWIAMEREYVDLSQRRPTQPGREYFARYAWIAIPNAIDLNAAGNLAVSGPYKHNRSQGWSPSEVDLGTYLAALGISGVNPFEVADDIVEYRNQASGNPGASGVDDDDNNHDTITIAGMQIPGATQDGIDHNVNNVFYEGNEGIDDPGEFHPLRLFGDDRVVKSHFDLYGYSALGNWTTDEAKENYVGLLTSSALTSYDSDFDKESLWRAAEDGLASDPTEVIEDYAAEFAAAGFDTNKSAQLAVNLVDFIDEDSIPTAYPLPPDEPTVLGVEECPLLEEVCLLDEIHLQVSVVPGVATNVLIRHAVLLDVELFNAARPDRPDLPSNTKIVPLVKFSNFTGSVDGDGGESLDHYFPLTYGTGGPLFGSTNYYDQGSVYADMGGIAAREFATLRYPFDAFDDDHTPETAEYYTAIIAYDRLADTLSYEFEVEIEIRDGSASGDLLDTAHIKFEVENRPIPINGTTFNQAERYYLASYSCDDPRVNADETDWARTTAPSPSGARLDSWVDSLEPTYTPGNPEVTSDDLEGDYDEGTGENPYAFHVANGPMASPGALGLLHRGDRWRTLRLDDAGDKKDRAAIDRFTAAYVPGSTARGRINLNTDNVAALTAVFGRLHTTTETGTDRVLTPAQASKLAEAVLKYRDGHGAFTSVGDLGRVWLEQEAQDVLDAVYGSDRTHWENEQILRRVANLVTVRPTFTIYGFGQTLALEDPDDTDSAGVITGESVIRAFVEADVDDDGAFKKFWIRDFRYVTRPVSLAAE